MAEGTQTQILGFAAAVTVAGDRWMQQMLDKDSTKGDELDSTRRMAIMRSNGPIRPDRIDSIWFSVYVEYGRFDKP